MNTMTDAILQVMELCIDGIFIEDLYGMILLCNSAGAKMFGYTQEELFGVNIRELVADEQADYLKDKYSKEDLFENEYKERLNKKKDGTIFTTAINSKIVEIDGEEYLVAIVRDMTRELGIRNQLYNLSHYDELTNIRNRRAIWKYIEEIRTDYVVGILDLDDFKQVNDRYGHSVGDLFLEQLARLLKEEALLVPGRIGGEEFLVVFEAITLEEATIIMNSILIKANNALKEYGGIYFSCGLVEVKEKQFEEALEVADSLLYVAKRTGKNRVMSES